jgi:hypothetical protein
MSMTRHDTETAEAPALAQTMTIAATHGHDTA